MPNGIVHRDLKPDNLMLVPDAVAPGGERVKILDFGIAKLTDKDIPSVKTETQAIMGTPMYMSPEQCQGAGRVDAKTDVYSLGCVLYEALSGVPPFLGEGNGEILAKHLFQEPVPLRAIVPAVSEPIAALVHRLLTKDKSGRPSMTQAADELGTLLAGISPVAPVLRTPISQPHDPEATRAVGCSPKHVEQRTRTVQWTRLGVA
jgi:serine/threonine protein kinase